jgi:hypothetical protein
VETGAISTASPARQSDRMGIDIRDWQKSPPMAAFCNSAGSLHAPNFTGHGLKSRKVSGRSLKYSRFRETVAGDWVRSALRGRACSGNIGKFSAMATGKLGPPLPQVYSFVSATFKALTS